MNMSKNYLVFDQRDENNRVIQLIWFYKNSFDFLRLYSEILLMNVTYKMNEFNFSMMNIIDVMTQNRTFYVDEVFMKENTKFFI